MTFDVDVTLTLSLLTSYSLEELTMCIMGRKLTSSFSTQIWCLAEMNHHSFKNSSEGNALIVTVFFVFFSPSLIVTVNCTQSNKPKIGCWEIHILFLKQRSFCLQVYDWIYWKVVVQCSWSPRPISMLIIDRVFRATLGPSRGLTLGRSGRFNVRHHILL